uniref:Bardet-Biedl syndrome 7 protein n=1 Tax=Tetraselmis sp. GSL018 TaxID=582737 RepID=A0A061S2R3_9CHLO|mmetsp:Transcript_23588/g.56397  ORF Transcript_23588/g.56397 Transcript_23588/m.56397 type:complete len:724 (+) Transcript_23588:115-2286(+)
MELELKRLDVLYAEQSNPGTLALFEPGKSRQQRVVLGDSKGLVQCFGVRKTEAVSIFKSLPLNQNITSLTVGNGEGQRDKAYIACDQTVRGMNKKGKEFFRFATNLTERINKVIVDGQHMWLAGEYNFNQYLDCKDRHFYMAPDRINAMELAHVFGEEPQVALGCQDRCLRVLNQKEVYYEIATDGPVSALAANPKRLTRVKQGAKPEATEMLLGTANGQIGQVLMDPESIRRGWMVPSEGSGDGVTALGCASDFTGDGLPDIIVGRSNGAVQIWGMDEAHQPKKVLSESVSESVLSLDTGFVCTPDSPDVVLQTYSGRVVTFTNSPYVYQSESSSVGRSGGASSQIDSLRSEIGELKTRLYSEQTRAETMAVDAPIVSGNVTQVRHSFLLDEENSGKYVLTLEAPVPLFGLALQSDTAVQLLDSEGAAIVSHSPPDIASGSMCLATYRCQESTNRIEVHMEVIEGQHGTLQCFPIPAQAPKTCHVVQCQLKPLCLHCRVDLPPGDKIPLNELKVSGGFEMGDIHSWIAAVLPEVTYRAPSAAEGVMHFRSTLLDTHLTCNYRAGSASFLSNSISALAILREAISREASSSKIRVSINYSLNHESVGHVMGLLWPRLVSQRDLVRKVEVMEALQELRIQDGDVSYMSDEHRKDLQNAEELRKTLRAQPRRLEYLIGVVKDLYIDWNKLNGGGGSSYKKVPLLEEMLWNPNTNKDEVVNFIMTN